MTVTDDAFGRLLAQVGAGTDCIVEGKPAACRRLLARAAAVWAERASVITVAAPLGELGLSALIAQVSGRPDLNDQDDAVLELGFKRLTTEGRQTILIMSAPHGIALPTLRYLQHVSRAAPRLVLVVLGSPALDAALSDPAAAGMRARLRAMPVIVAEDEAEPALPPMATTPVASSGPIPLSTPVSRRARLVPWAAAAVSVAAAAVIVVQISLAPGIDAPAADGTAADGAGADGAGAGMQKNSVVTPAPAPVEVPLTAVPTIDTPPPISFPPSPPATAPTTAPAVPPPAKPDRVLHARRPDPKPRSVARAGHPGPDWRTASPRINETTPYSSDGDPPLWRRWTPRWSEEQSQRGYYVDRYGMPLYPPGH